jgi:hypothetical protein
VFVNVTRGFAGEPFPINCESPWRVEDGARSQNGEALMRRAAAAGLILALLAVTVSCTNRTWHVVTQALPVLRDAETWVIAAAGENDPARATLDRAKYRDDLKRVVAIARQTHVSNGLIGLLADLNRAATFDSTRRGDVAALREITYAIGRCDQDVPNDAEPSQFR